MTLSPSVSQEQVNLGWGSSLQDRQYNRRNELTVEEKDALFNLVTSRYRWGDGGAVGARMIQSTLHRLVAPLREAMAAIDGKESYKDMAVAAILRACHREKCSFWGWDSRTWSRVLGADQARFLKENGPPTDSDARQYMIAAAYMLGCPVKLRDLGDFKRECLASKVFGQQVVNAAVSAVIDVLQGWGYSVTSCYIATVCELLLFNRSPYLQDLTPRYLDESRYNVSVERRARIYAVGRALAALGVFADALPIASGGSGQSPDKPVASTTDIVHPEWCGWVERWENTSTLTRSTRRGIRISLLKVGRWLQAHHPTVTRPDQWDRQLGIAYVAAVDRMRVGDYIVRRYRERGRSPQGQPILPRTKSAYIAAMRVFFRVLQEWGWMPTRLDPWRIFATPRSIKALIGPSPRTIAPDAWAKLLWAGLNLTADDLPGNTSLYYPVELLRALAMVWLFAALRSDEIVRLRTGCVRWQRDDVMAPATSESLSENAVCLLDVPVNKTGMAFAKPVDPLVGKAILGWEQVRPMQPAFPDRKTGQLVDFLFCYRARPLPREYINGGLIPMLCHKAQVPIKDVRGAITSHRARATIASQLFNARQPMSLFELQDWLGHRSPVTTRNYVALEPTRLAKAYFDAGYFARNLRAIEVLIDQDAIKSAAAASGEPWRYYDLGHGLCSYEFFEQCPHRMACPKCDFYSPKESSHGQVLEAKSNLMRLLQELPLTEEERACVDGDLTSLDRLVACLAEQPTPSGQTPEELRTCAIH
jgi:integrase